MSIVHKNLFSAALEGRELIRPWVKNPSVVTTAGIWIDLTCFGKYPAANYYTDGLVNSARQLKRSVDGGMDHGDSKGAGYIKLLTGFASLSVTAAANPLQFQIMDYLMYYPLVPMEDIQTMDNTVTLPRYTSGEGVQIMLVEQFPYVGGGTFRITYTNSEGQSGRVTPIQTINTQTALGTLATSAPSTAGLGGPFVSLFDLDGGVRSVESIEFLTPDAGNLAIVLVKPLAPAAQYENTAPAIWDHWLNTNQIHRIYDDAYISMICKPAGSLNGAILDGYIQTSWYGA